MPLSYSELECVWLVETVLPYDDVHVDAVCKTLAVAEAYILTSDEHDRNDMTITKWPILRGAPIYDKDKVKLYH